MTFITKNFDKDILKRMTINRMTVRRITLRKRSVAEFYSIEWH